MIRPRARLGSDSGAPSTAGLSSSATSVELTVDAAASLKDAIAAIATAYATAAPGTTLTVSTDSSATLRTQIEQGAPADVFLWPTRRTRRSSSMPA